MFIAHDFSHENRYWPRKKVGIWVADALGYQIMFRQTVLGWWNCYFVDHPDRPCVNLSPEAFHSILPDVDPRASIGCCEVDLETLQELGFSIEGIAEVAV